MTPLAGTAIIIAHSVHRVFAVNQVMTERRPNILLCSCEDTMPIDADAVRRSCPGAGIQTATRLCRAELERFRSVMAAGAPVIVACTQEAPLFRATASADSAN